VSLDLLEENMIADLWQDLGYGARTLLKQPGFTLIAVLTPALGIGSTTTIFSAVWNILLNPFPYPDADRMVAIRIHDTNSSGRGRGPQMLKFLDYQEQNHVFEDIMGATGDNVLYDSGDGMEQFSGCYVTPNTFSFLGVPAQLGRVIRPDDARPDAPPVFVMAHKLLVKRFNQDPSILGKTFTLNGTPTTLVGIMPKHFTFYFPDLWIARAMDRAAPSANRDYWYAQAKLKPGVTIQQAQADIEVIARRLAQIYPDDYPQNFRVRVVDFVDDIVGQFSKTLYTIAAAVGLLLLIACSNVANMLLARATARGKEMAIRSAVGASRMRLVGQLLTESLLLALGGAIVGCLFSYAGIKGLVTLIPEDGLIPSEVEIRLNLHAPLFSLGTAVGSAALFGAADGPGLQSGEHPVCGPAIPKRPIHDGRRETAVLRAIAATAERGARRGGGDRDDHAPAVWRHRQRNRHRREDAHREMAGDHFTMQRRLFPDAAVADDTRPRPLGNGGEQGAQGRRREPDVREQVPQQ
jgi:putative ABC transport system permease protein